jgi:hypothetical protein
MLESAINDRKPVRGQSKRRLCCEHDSEFDENFDDFVELILDVLDSHGVDGVLDS